MNDIPNMTPEMKADLARYNERQAEAQIKAAAKKTVKEGPSTFEEARAQLQAALSQLPETVSIPYELTPEGERMAQFKTLLEDSPEFLQRIDRSLLPNPVSFDRVAQWDGRFPGPCAWGATNGAKTRAAWSALGRLFVKEGIPFAWFPARRLVTELARYEEKHAAADFFRMYDFHRILFVDDVDKINWQFDSEKSALFAFYDWVYRHQKPVISTTNQSQSWWTERMGAAFARRLFDGAHFPVPF